MAVAILSDFSGGENSNAPPQDLRSNQAQVLQNVRFRGGTGGVEKRKGMAKYNATAVTGSTNGVRGLYRYYFGSSKKLIVGYHTNLYVGDDGAGTLATISGGTSYTADLFWNFETWRDFLFAVNGQNNTIQKWSGTGAIAGIAGSPTSAVDVADYMERLWAASGSTLYFSADGDETSWDLVNDAFPIGENTGAPIRRISAVFGQYLLAWKDMTTWMLSGEEKANFGVRPFFKNLGMISPRSLATSDNVAIWLSHRGVVYFDGNQLHDISEPIDDAIRPALEDATGRTQFAGGLNGFLYWLSFPSAAALAGDGKNDSIRVFDIRRGSWLRDTRAFQVFHSLDGPGDTGQLYAGDPTAGTVYKLDETNADAGSDFEWKVKTRKTAFGRKDWLKQLQRVRREGDMASSSTVTLAWDIDGNTGSTTDGKTTTPATHKGVFADFTLSASDSLDWDGKTIRGVIAEAVPERSALW